MHVQNTEIPIILPSYYLEVEQDSWALAEGMPLVTWEASSCFVIAVHDEEQEVGYLGHFLMPSEDNRKSLKGMLDEIHNNQPDSSRLSAWIGGASLTGRKPRHDTLIEEYRINTISKLSHIATQGGILKSSWLGVDEKLAAAILDPESKSLRLAAAPSDALKSI